MNTYIAFLRGINVGGKKKILMQELRDLLTKNGFQNVKTYIQSGNIIFTSQESNTYQLEAAISKSIQLHFNLEVPVLVKGYKEVRDIFDNCPFSEEEKKHSYFSLLYQAPSNALLTQVSELEYQKASIAITKHCVYFYSAIGYGKTKYNNTFFEGKLKVVATARNYKTIKKLLELALEV